MLQCPECLRTSSPRQRVFVCARCRSTYATTDRRPTTCPRCGFDPLTQLEPLYRLAAFAAVIIAAVLFGLAMLG
jgi:hypothetical protein